MKKLLIKVILSVILILALEFAYVSIAKCNRKEEIPANTISFAEITEFTIEEDTIEIEELHSVIVQGKKNNESARDAKKSPSEFEDEIIFNEEGDYFIEETTTTCAATTTAAPVVVPTTTPAATAPPIVETQPIVTEPEIVVETQPIVETEPESIPETVIETVVETTPAPTTTAAPPQTATPLYKVNDPAVPGGAVMAEDLQNYLYQRLAERGIGWFMPYAIGIAYQESHFNIYAENKNGLDKGLFQYRITYYPGANIFDPYEQIRIFSDQMANRLNSGCSVEVAVSRHMMSDYGAYNPSYVALIMGWVNVTTRIR